VVIVSSKNEIIDSLPLNSKQGKGILSSKSYILESIGIYYNFSRNLITPE
jgi:hypothetical protein